MSPDPIEWDQTVDVVVIGSGNGGFTAAITAKLLGSDTIMLEKMPYFGGSSAISGGGVWIPNNPVNQRAGVPDSVKEARTYLDSIIQGRVPDSRIDAFLTAGPEMIDFLEKRTEWVRYQRVGGYPDYHPENPGGRPLGRSIEPSPVDSNLLGDEAGSMTPGALRPPGGLWILTPELHHLSLAARTWQGKATALKIAARTLYHRLRGRRMMSCGSAGVARLRLAARDAGVPLHLETALRSLVTDDDGAVVGVEAEHDGETVRIRARQAVILASGGFERNEAMRKEYQQEPISGSWTMGALGNLGEGINAGIAVGADVDLMDDAWWGPAIDLGESALFLLIERAMPGAIIVNAAGQRYFNEASPYVNFVHRMYEGDGDPFIPSYLIFDQAYRNHYPFSVTPPRRPLPEDWVKSGVVKTAPTLAELARTIGVDPDGLATTVQRHNQFAQTGKDLDFGKGDSAYDRFYSDYSIKPNPNLAPIGKAPFYAFRILPGDLGTKGGLVCDYRSRVLRPDGSVIEGLYATGNSSAAVMGNEYAGPGATLGPAMTFGYVAARDAVGRTTT
jgi:3-oxosteroid 1-dehydrogenase